MSEDRLKIPIAEAYMPLLRPARYKGLRGGRGAGRSHFVAERMVTECSTSHQRVACLREYQASMDESIKRLIEDKIIALGLTDLFRTTSREIRGPYDSLIIFKGLQGSSAHSLKSLEGYTRAVVEEAQPISRASLDMMTPTFRRTPTMIDDPQMYFCWNPVSPKDPIEQLFSNREPDDPDFVCVTTNYRDNPWFPSDLRKDMERDRRRDKDRYAHVWLGRYRVQSQARVFSDWRVEEFETPADARFYFGADWGFAQDPTVLIRCWLRGRNLHIDYEAVQVGCKIERTPALFDTIPGSRLWPIRADSARPETIDYMKDHGFRRMTPSVKGHGSVEDGIEFLKSFSIIIHPRCVHTSDEFASYAFKVDKKTEEILPLLEDDNNHVIDACRYALEGERLAPPMVKISDAAMARAGVRTSPGYPTTIPPRAKIVIPPRQRL